MNEASCNRITERGAGVNELLRRKHRLLGRFVGSDNAAEQRRNGWTRPTSLRR